MGNLLFEIKNGKGKIKEYDENCNLIFEGEYLNGEKNGRGKEYYENGELKFDGEYLNNKRWNDKGFKIDEKFSYELKEGNGLVEEYDQYGFLELILNKIKIK